MFETARVEESQTSQKFFENRLQHLVESKIYNHGLNSFRQFEFQGPIYKSEPIKVHDRRIFLADSIRHKIENFSVMDVVNLRQADMAIDGIRGNKAADLLLNQLSHAVVDYLNIYNSKNKTVNFCRYGGDEFSFSYSGLNNKEIEEFNQKINILTSNIKGFYRTQLTGEKIEEKKVEVEFKTINKPKDSFGKGIFDYFINNGVLLKQEEVAKLKNKFISKKNFNKWQQNEKKPDFYPEKCENISQKLKYLSKLNPLLEIEINELIKLANDLGNESQNKLQKDLESIFIDPLLKSPFLSASDIIENISAGKISHIWTKDLKFLKQLNNISYADGDNAIKILWENINGFITADDQEKLVFARNGGTFVIGLKAGQVISLETSKILTELTSVLYKEVLGNNNLSISIGSYDHDIKKELIEKKYGLITKLSDDQKIRFMNLMAEENKLIFSKSDDWFYKQLAENFIFSDQDGHTEWDLVFPLNYTNLDGPYVTSLIHDFFISKRAIQHLTGLERALDNPEIDRVIRTKYNENIQLIIIRRQILEKVREAMIYSRSNNMTEPEELKELNRILSD